MTADHQIAVFVHPDTARGTVKKMASEIGASIIGQMRSAGVYLLDVVDGGEERLLQYRKMIERYPFVRGTSFERRRLARQ